VEKPHNPGESIGEYLKKDIAPADGFLYLTGQMHRFLVQGANAQYAT
jgi:hypothetical protein